MTSMPTQQFATYLFRGLGRPHLYLQQHNSAPYLEVLLHACVYNPVYDRQCAGSRAQYLFELISLTHDHAMFEQHILDALSRLDETMDAEQLFDFALLYAQAGNQQARLLMYEQFTAHAGDGYDVGSTQLIRLDGIDGFRFVAARLGEAARLDPEFWDSDHLLMQLKAHVPTITDADIAALGHTDRSIQTYLAVVAQTMTRREQAAQQRKQALRQPYVQLKTQLATSTQIPYGRLRRWGELAPVKELQAAARDLLKQDDPRLLASYLAIFTKRQFPFAIHPLLPYVRHPVDRVARWTLDALSLFRNPRLRDLGLELLRDNWHASDALGLFNLNYQMGDDQRFVLLLEAAQTDEEVHAIAFGLLDVLRHHHGVHSTEILRILYEHQPCSLCRNKVVKLLGELQAIPEWMRQECRYDADADTRTIVFADEADSQSD